MSCCGSEKKKRLFPKIARHTLVLLSFFFPGSTRPTSLPHSRERIYTPTKWPRKPKNAEPIRPDSDRPSGWGLVFLHVKSQRYRSFWPSTLPWISWQALLCKKLTLPWDSSTLLKAYAFLSTQQFTLHRLTRAASQLISGIHTLLTSIEAQIGRQFHANATPQSHRNVWHRPEKAVEMHRLRPGQWLFWIFGGLEGLDRLVETAVAKNLAKRTWAFRLHTQQLPSRNPKSQCQTETILSYQSVEQKNVNGMSLIQLLSWYVSCLALYSRIRI